MRGTAVAAPVAARTAGTTTITCGMGFRRMAVGDRQLTVMPPVSEQSAVVCRVVKPMARDVKSTTCLAEQKASQQQKSNWGSFIGEH